MDIENLVSICESEILKYTSDPKDAIKLAEELNTTLCDRFHKMRPEKEITVAYCFDYGGWELNKKFQKEYNERYGTAYTTLDFMFIDRTDPNLIELLRDYEKRGEIAGFDFCVVKLKSAFCRDYSISEYDGKETVNFY